MYSLSSGRRAHLVQRTRASNPSTITIPIHPWSSHVNPNFNFTTSSNRKSGDSFQLTLTYPRVARSQPISQAGTHAVIASALEYAERSGLRNRLPPGGFEAHEQDVWLEVYPLDPGYTWGLMDFTLRQVEVEVELRIFNGTKSIALPFGAQNYRPDFSIPQSFHHQTKRDDEQEESKAFCTGVLLYAKIQAAFSGFPSRAPSFSKADIKNGWTVVDTLNELGLDDRWHLPYQSISGGQTPENKGARDVLAFQGEPFVNKMGERITKTQDAAVYYATYFASPPSIFSLNLRSPTFEVRRKHSAPPITQDQVDRLIPPLNRFSDMIWTIWSNGIGKADPGRLRYIGHDTIENPTSKLIMGRILTQKRGTAFAEWPGEGFDMTSVEGLTLLGTPNGGGVGYVLLDRADVLGRRQTSLSVRIWTVGENYFQLWDLGQRQDGDGMLEMIGDGSVLPL
ncbi:MAG: hypothetical protein Q9202_006179 [Teloschistes flavicans]